MPHSDRRRARRAGVGRLVGSLRGRLLAVAVAVMAPLMLGAGLCVTLLAHSAGNYKDLAGEGSRETDASVKMLQRLNAAEDAGSRYMEGGEADDLGEFRAAGAKVDRQLGETGTAVYDEGSERRRVASISRVWSAAKRRLQAAEGNGAPDDAQGQDPEDRFELETDKAIAGVKHLLADSEEELRRELGTSARVERLNWALGLAAVALALIVAGFLAFRMSRAFERPLQQLARAARSLGSGHLGHRVSISSTSELEEVGGTFNAMAAALQDQREELERQAFADSLTGLPNRALFEDRARHALGTVPARGERVAVLVLDLDGFKLVNDALGHPAGDSLLKQAAERMAAALRPSDTLARLGGDEFAVLLEDIRGLDDALGAAERVRRSLGTPFHLKGSDVVVTASVGIALSTASTKDEAELLRRADLAMYRVKERGKDGSEFFDPDMDDQAAERLETLNALRKAVDQNELVVHYQPIVDLGNGEIRAAEALMRWRRPGAGLVAPGDFIPLAEDSGLIVPLGAWVLQAACAEARRWEESLGHALPVTVNVSARQLLEPDFESTVAKALRLSGLRPSGLILEVTESSVIQNTEVVIAKLDSISATGVGIALDDFGEGYSSLGHLRQLPIDTLKIARPFIAKIADDGEDPALVRGIIELAHSLGLRLIAEGIEHPGQRATLRALNCPLGQGFLFGRPMSAVDMRTLLAQPTAEVGVSGTLAQ